MELPENRPARAAGGPSYGVGLATLVVAVAMPVVGDYAQGGHTHWDERLPVLAGIGAATILLVALLVRRAVMAPPDSRMPATSALVVGAVAPLGVLVFFLSAPIVFGGVALALGVTAWRRRDVAGGRRRTIVGFVLGAVAFGGGVALMLFA